MSFLLESPRSNVLENSHARYEKRSKLQLAKSQSYFHSAKDQQTGNALRHLKSIGNLQKCATPKSALSRPQTGLARLKPVPSDKEKAFSGKQKSFSTAKDGASTMEETQSSTMAFNLCFQQREILDLFSARCADSQIYFCKEKSAKFLQKIEQCCRDRRIDLSSSSMGFQTLSCLCTFISSAGLSHINLEKNQIGDSGAIELSKLLRSSTTLVYLNIASNNIRETGAQHIFGGLRYNESLVELDISSKEGLNKNCIRSGTRSLRDSLKHNITLAILNLSCTQLNLEGLSHLAAGLKSNIGISSLNIGNNDLGENCVEDVMHILREHELLELNLANNRMGNSSIKKLMEFISKVNKSLRVEHLNLSGNGITVRSSNCLFDMLRKNSSLRILNLGGNHFDHDSRMMSLLLQDNSDLHTLILDDCKINASFACSLSDGLRKSRSLQSLCLNRNPLDLECVSYILRGLESNQSLERLELKNCHLEDSSAEIFGSVLPKNNTIKHLNLSDNYITDPGAIRLIEGMTSNSSLRQVLLKSNFVSYKLLNLIGQKLAKNRLIQMQQKLPRCRQKLESIQHTTSKDANEVQDFDRYLQSKESKLTTEIAILKLDLAEREERARSNLAQYEAELKEADGVLRQLNSKLSISQLIDENINRKIEQAKARLDNERRALSLFCEQVTQ